MTAKLFVAGLPFAATVAEVRAAFEEFGAVESVKLVHDRDTGRPKGYGFVEMRRPEDADRAREALDGSDFGGRRIRVEPGRG